MSLKLKFYRVDESRGSSLEKRGNYILTCEVHVREDKNHRYGVTG